MERVGYFKVSFFVISYNEWMVRNILVIDLLESPKSFEKKELVSIISIIPCNNTQPAMTCSKLSIETLEQGVKYVPS